MNKKNLPGFTDWYEEFANTFRTDLQALHRKGDVSLPLGLQQTVQAHINLYQGAIYTIVANHDADVDAVIHGLKSSLALTAGAKLAAVQEAG